MSSVTHLYNFPLSSLTIAIEKRDIHRTFYFQPCTQDRRFSIAEGHERPLLTAIVVLKPHGLQAFMGKCLVSRNARREFSFPSEKEIQARFPPLD